MIEKMISIIVPVYNAENYIEKCVNSLQNQTYKNIEIILVDDGSTDNSYDICKKIVDENQNINLITKTNQGVTIARLTGVYVAKGDYISFVDADDWIEEDYIACMMGELSDGDIIAGGIRKIYKEENYRTENEYNRITSGVYEVDNSLFVKKIMCHPSAHEPGVLWYLCNKIYKKNVLLPLMEQVDKNINDGEDVAIIFPYILNSKKIVISNNCGYNYLIHKASACATKRQNAYDNASRLYSWLYGQFKKTNFFEIMLPQLQKYFLMMVWKYDPAVYIGTNEFVFPYKEIKTGSNIILYGAGDVGESYYTQVQQSKYCKVVAWADKNKEYCDKFDVNLVSPIDICTYEFDYVVIAIRSEYLHSVIKGDLLKLGVDETKIV